LRRAASPRLGAYTGLAGAGLLLALVLGRAELVVLALPFGLVVGLGLLLGRELDVRAAVSCERERALEGDEFELELDLRSPQGAWRLETFVALPEGLTLADGRNPVLLRLRPGELSTLPLTVRCERWGAYLVGETYLRARDPLGLFVYESSVEPSAPLRVFPREQVLRSLLRPRDTQVFAGDELARRLGSGIEFADLRPFAYGDPVRHVNWRASARRGTLWVNERHPERNTDVVLFLDTFAEVRRGTASTLDLVVRAAAAIAARYVRRRDRVGLVSFGGVLRWLVPGSGLTQLYRIADALLDTELVLNYAWKDLEVVPRRTLPPQALVIALTPLLDERSVNALLDLRARGFDLAVVETSPLPYADPGETEEDRIAFRIWRLRRAALRARYRRAGVAVTEWSEETPLAAALEEVTRFRRHAVLGRG
jgi:uncharacterized protein (DUF58 family)